MPEENGGSIWPFREILDCRAFAEYRQGNGKQFLRVPVEGQAIQTAADDGPKFEGFPSIDESDGSAIPATAPTTPFGAWTLSATRGDLSSTSAT